MADREVQHEVVLGGIRRTGRADALKNSLLAALGATVDRARARHARVHGGRALPLLRPRGHHLRRDPADRAPGIVTGLALQATIIDVLGPLGITFGLTTIIIGHATFCVVVIYNNVIARMRRTAGSLDEASADLGADNWQTFRYVMLPQMRTALLAGGLLAFALSFDEVIVTVFTSGAQQTLPIWIFATLFRPASSRS